MSPTRASIDGDWVILTFIGSIFSVLVFSEYNSLSVTKYVSESEFINILGSGVDVLVGEGVEGAVDVRVTIAIGIGVESGTHEVKIIAISKTVTLFLIFIDYLILQGNAQLCFIWSLSV
ncbi:hypothetical protein MASR2M66_08750 [Chloroflexota bacterium]